MILFITWCKSNKISRKRLRKLKKRIAIGFKICGLKDPDNIKKLVALAPDFMGFIFYPESPRYVVNQLDKEIIKQVPGEIKKVGVFVNEKLDKTLDLAREYHLNVLQLHGNETPEYCADCRESYPVIKAFGVSEDFNFDLPEKYKDSVDYFLFDTKTAKHGGSGQKFDWRLLKNYRLDIPYFISGGIGDEDVEALIKADIPPGFLIDVNSKIEIRPGLKDVNKARAIKDKIGKIIEQK